MILVSVANPIPGAVFFGGRGVYRRIARRIRLKLCFDSARCKSDMSFLMVCMERRVGFHFHATDRVMLYPRFRCCALRPVTSSITYPEHGRQKRCTTISTIDQRRRPNRLCA